MADSRYSDDSSEGDLGPLTAVNPADIRMAAMDLLARREHSRRELKQKLARRFADEGLIEEQLDRLTEENLQSDARYAESFLRQRISRGHGPMRIRQEMRQKGISDGEITAALDAEGADWFALAEQAFQRKFGVLPAADIKENSRRNRFMQYRGFSLEHYQHLLEES
ncbi:regulatory protein RecX [Seongchinamella sediminis]|uniref:Regulatory protein RecX n=1 Tax=Seongchinamella sediminis TaxID=2283635 RepID=A0A3L7DVS5_9GAMM|nr:regulatory protein RecX [Seongchinamella sediminis]RLQ21667.1 regulatory protein RecX [Seongchinamella sediminis]